LIISLLLVSQIRFASCSFLNMRPAEGMNKKSLKSYNEFRVNSRVSEPRKRKAFIQMFDDVLQNSTNSTNSTVPLPPGIFPTNVTFLINLNLDMKAKATFAKYTKCKEKSGLLYLLKNEDIADKNDPSKHSKGITLRPILIVLNEFSFSVQDNQIPQSLIQAIILEKILRVTQTYKGTTCFDIVEDKKELNPIHLCAENKDEMDEWIVGILEFKECLLKEKFEIIDANTNAFAKKEDPKKENKEDIKRGKGVVPPIKPPTPVNPLAKVEVPVKPVIIPDALFYTNTFAPTSEVQEITETDVTLTKILNDKKREEIAQRQIKRQIEDKIRKVKEAHKRILLQEKKMAKKNSANKKKEIAIETQKIENNAKKQENDILNSALKNMQKMNKQDLEEYKVTISKPIIEEKKRTRSQVQRIMKMAEQNQVNQPFDECLDNRLEGFKDIKYVKEVCQKMFGEDLCEVCEQKDNFCQKCCGHRIGQQYINKLAKCKVQCGALIN